MIFDKLQLINTVLDTLNLYNVAYTNKYKNVLLEKSIKKINLKEKLLWKWSITKDLNITNYLLIKKKLSLKYLYLYNKSTFKYKLKNLEHIKNLNTLANHKLLLYKSKLKDILNISKKYKSYKKYNTYLNIHILYQDFFINKFINIVLLNEGKKYKAFSIFKKALHTLKQLTSISPVRIIKSLLNIERMLITYSTKSIGRKLLKIIKFNNKKNLYLKYLSFFKKQLSKLTILKHYTIYEKLVYYIIYNILNKNNNWKELIKENVLASHIYDRKNFLLYKKY